MADHTDMTLLMSLSLDGMLSPEDQRALDGHLHTCDACRVEWERWQQIDALLEAEQALAPAPGFSARVAEQLEQRGRSRRRLLGRALLVGGSLSVWGMVSLALVVANLLWMVSDPSMAVYFAHVLTQLVSAAGLLVKAVLMGLESMASPSVWPWVAGYLCVVLALTALWVRLVRRPPGNGQVLALLG